MSKANVGMVSEADTIDADKSAAAVLAWLRKLDEWPKLAPREYSRALYEATERKGNLYYGVQAFVLSLIRLGSMWPTLPPPRMAEGLSSDPTRFRDLIVRYAKAVIVVEAENEKGS